MPDEVKGTVFRENCMGDYKQGYDKKAWKIWSNNFGPKPNLFKLLFYTLDRFEWSKKLSHATVPLNVGGGRCLLLVRRKKYSKWKSREKNQ